MKRNRAKLRPAAEPVPEAKPPPAIDYCDVPAHLYPDFANPKTPSHVLIGTGDGTLFWFSLSLLSHHSSAFAQIDHNTRLPRYQPIDGVGCLNLPTIPPGGFAILLHVLQRDWQQSRQDALLVESPLLPLPDNVFGSDLVKNLDEALSIASHFGFQSFLASVQSHLLAHARMVGAKDPHTALVIGAICCSMSMVQWAVETIRASPAQDMPVDVHHFLARRFASILVDLQSTLRGC